jgi:peptide/nickel transport system permease protein
MIEQFRSPKTPFQLAVGRFKAHKVSVWGLAVLCVLILAAICAPLIAPYDPNAIDLSAGAEPTPPSLAHIFGTDNLGRDYFSRALYGARISISVGFVAMGLAIATGTLLGAMSGYVGGTLDSLIMRFTDIMLSFPSFFLILIVQTMLTPSIYNVMAVIGLTGWMGVARLVRAEVLSVRERDYVMAATSVGVRGFRIVFRHIIPNVLGSVIVAASLRVPSAILAESGLSFLGLGVQPPQASWGNMLQEARTYMESAWWIAVFPGLLIALTVTSFNFVGDGLRDAFDPHSY